MTKEQIQRRTESRKNNGKPWVTEETKLKIAKKVSLTAENRKKI